MIILFGVAGLAFGWFVYSRFIAEKIYQLDPNFQTPAHELNDGVDYVPTNIYRIKLLPYLAFALAVFSLILLAQYALLKKHKNFEEIVERKLSIFYLIVCGLGHIAIVPWFGAGMEMNVFGLFIPFILILSAIIFFYEVTFFFRGKKDKP